MMYQSKLVASLKANGKILREFKDTVYIPFGSEYSFLIKNLNTTRALVNIFIDGDNVIEGGLVLNAGQEVDLERYVKNGNLNAGNKFKFIERTQAIEDGPRGAKLEDGIVRIEFQFEKPYIPPVSRDWITAIGGTNQNSIYPASFNVNGALRSVDFSQNGQVMAQAASAAVDKYCADNGIVSKSEVHDGMATMDWMDAPKNDIGITVPGSKSTQKFQTTYMGAMEAEKHTIVLKLLGETPDNKPVLAPVTVKAKQECDTCGHKNKATAKFCNKCGTSLEVFA
jgi:hypothetical protein